MGGSLFEARDFAPAGLALKNARDALVDEDVDPFAKGTVVVAPHATPWPQDLIKKSGNRRVTSAFSSAVARPFPASISRQLRRTILELWCVEEGGGSLWGEVPIKEHFTARLSPVEQKNGFSSL